MSGYNFGVVPTNAARLLLPQGIEVIREAQGLRFRGNAAALIQLGARLRKFAEMPDGALIRVGNWTLGLHEQQPLSYSETLIAMPSGAWNVAASKFIEVATGWEESPFDFSQCGFLWPAPDPDIGVELVGPPNT